MKSLTTSFGQTKSLKLADLILGYFVWETDKQNSGYIGHKPKFQDFFAKIFISLSLIDEITNHDFEPTKSPKLAGLILGYFVWETEKYNSGYIGHKSKFQNIFSKKYCFFNES